MKKLIVAVLISILAISLTPAIAVEQPQVPLRIGLTPTFPSDQYRALEEWRRYLEQRLQRKVEFIRRDSYIEAMELLRLQKVDFAWICDYTYVFFKDQTKLLAVPVYQGRPYYQSYLIVPAKDMSTTSISQLKHATFAYADPYSNTGYLTPRYELKLLGENPSQFFSKTFFTWSHRKTIEAVAAGLAQGAAVSSHVWDTLSKAKPELTSATRIVSKSGDYGFSPFVARTSISDAEFRNMQNALITMGEETESKKLLEGLNLDGFVVGDSRIYSRVDQMMKNFSKP